MEHKIENPVSNKSFELSLYEFKFKFTNYMMECQISKNNFKKEIEALQNSYDELLDRYGEMIATVRKQIAEYEKRLPDSECYIEEDILLPSRIRSEINRQTQYLVELESQLPRINTLKFLSSLNSIELLQEALNNKSYTLLIIQTPSLISKITNAQIAHISHKDPEIIKSLASILAAREYTFETPNFFAALKQQVQEQELNSFIGKKENEAVHNLLLKINNYLDKKIEKALKGNNSPWELGYFGSRYKLKRGDKNVPVPQGIYELKEYLDQLHTIPASEILSKMQSKLQLKNSENKDESLFQRFKRLISFLLGYNQSPETTKEYEYLEEAAAGKNSIS